MTQIQVTEPPTYQKGGHSYFRDLVLSRIDEASDAAIERLRRHSVDASTIPEFRQFIDQPSEAVSSRHIPPLYLLQQMGQYSSAARAYTDLASISRLPNGTDSVNVSKLVGVREIDLTDTDTFISAPVRTVVGEQGIAIALLLVSPVLFDEVVWRDLVTDHATRLDCQVIDGAGTSGQMLGVRTDAPKIHQREQDDTTVYDRIWEAAQKVYDERFMPPSVVAMHPSRLAWCLADAAGGSDELLVSGNADTRQVVLVGQLQRDGKSEPAELPITTDTNMVDARGRDFIHVMRATDLILWESGPRVRVIPKSRSEHPPTTIDIALQLHSQTAFTAARYPTSVVEVVPRQMV